MATDIKKLLGSEKLVIGTDRVLKIVRQGGAEKVLLARNAPAELREQLAYYHQVEEFDLEEVEMTNDELGTYCKKPFSIAVLAIRT